jgi:hypothetical protein
VSGESAEQPLRRVLRQLSDGLSLERSISHHAGMLVAVAQDPCFTDGAIARQWRCEKIAQLPAAPKPILEDRFESQRIEWYVIHQTYPGLR